MFSLHENQLQIPLQLAERTAFQEKLKMKLFHLFTISGANAILEDLSPAGIFAEGAKRAGLPENFSFANFFASSSDTIASLLIVFLGSLMAKRSDSPAR